jgi:hypothetical protein
VRPSRSLLQLLRVAIVRAPLNGNCYPAFRRR